MFYFHVLKLMLFRVDLIKNIVKGLRFMFTEAKGFTDYTFYWDFPLTCYQM